jgi:hypothetical protein
VRKAVPAPAAKHKGKGREIVPELEQDVEMEEVPAPAKKNKGKGREIVPAPAPAAKQQGKGKEIEPAPVRETKHEGESAPLLRGRRKAIEKEVPDDEESEGEYGEGLARGGVDKGKPAPTPAPPQSKRRRPPKSTGRRQVPPCHRCEKKNIICYAQAGFTQACVACAMVKMKCDPVSDDDREPVSTPVVPVKRPAPEAKAGPAKKRVKKAPAPPPPPPPPPSPPVASSSKVKIGKSREFVDMSEEETALDGGKLTL